ncbi:NAD(P)-binding protein [Obba rivulosa]|uniref:NAD(P)-binding protein n=1 Tax=Obba rivulosa TaxID=1052685 RepID=A0A8E2DSY7_9APHY|nr:NAD(P)-binding protein [Obba rivulosa]
MSNLKVWFITGASTGFGRAMTELVLKNGDAVVATLRKPEVLAGLSAQYPVDRLLVLKLDVQNENEIIAAFAAAKEKFGRLDVVFNNAACGVLSEVESAAGNETLVRDMFEVNFWGATHVSQAAVKFFREVNKPGIGGRLLQVSSLAGIEGVPTFGFYNATKFALEGISEALAKELDPSWNIKVTIIEPGAFITEGQSKITHIDPLPAYAKAPAAFIRSSMSALTQKPSGADPLKAVKAFYRLANLPEPPLHFPIGEDAIEAVRRKTAGLLADTDAFTSWSEGLGFTGDKIDLD